MSGPSGEDLRARARRLIPGGCHTYSKGDDQFPHNAPPLIERAQGCRCWDPDGGEWLDWGMGLRAVMLGHAYQPVLEAVRRELDRGSNFTRPAPLEGALAERLQALFPAAEMVKLAKNGSDVTTAAVRLARAYTGRDLVAACAANPFYSFDDWWIGRTETAAGVPSALSRLTHLFGWNDLASLEAIFAAHPGQVACVILEPVSVEPAADGFLAGLIEMAHRHGALVIFDEMICGFRYHLRGAFGLYGLTPDMATYGKALANGFSVSALVGRSEVMRLGGADHDRERVFLLSATHSGETHALAAALATVNELERLDVARHVAQVGGRLQEGLRAAATDAGLDGVFACRGHPASPTIVCRDAQGRVSLPMRTLFLQEMAARRVLIPYVAPSLAHGPAEVDETLRAAREALLVYRQALEDGDALRHLGGPVVKPVFRRYP